MSEIAIKNNIIGGDQYCAVCGQCTFTSMGPDLFLEGTMQVVCRECGRDIVPNLVQLLELSDRAVMYSTNSVF